MKIFKGFCGGVLAATIAVLTFFTISADADILDYIPAIVCAQAGPTNVVGTWNGTMTTWYHDGAPEGSDNAVVTITQQSSELFRGTVSVDGGDAFAVVGSFWNDNSFILDGGSDGGGGTSIFQCQATTTTISCAQFNPGTNDPRVGYLELTKQ